MMTWYPKRRMLSRRRNFQAQKVSSVKPTHEVMLREI
jgi:hypothetical protein